MTGKSKQLKDLLTGDKETDVPSPITQELLNKFVIARQALTHLFLLPGPRVGYQLGATGSVGTFLAPAKVPRLSFYHLEANCFFFLLFLRPSAFRSGTDVAVAQI